MSWKNTQHNMIQYSGNMWGEANANGHSRCETIAEYLEKSQVMLLNQEEATRDGGMYCTLIGDMRKQGQFHSFQADCIKMMPKASPFYCKLNSMLNLNAYPTPPKHFQSSQF